MTTEKKESSPPPPSTEAVSVDEFFCYVNEVASGKHDEAVASARERVSTLMEKLRSLPHVRSHPGAMQCLASLPRVCRIEPMAKATPAGRHACVFTDTTKLVCRNIFYAVPVDCKDATVLHVLEERGRKLTYERVGTFDLSKLCRRVVSALVMMHRLHDSILCIVEEHESGDDLMDKCMAMRKVYNNCHSIVTWWIGCPPPPVAH